MQEFSGNLIMKLKELLQEPKHNYTYKKIPVIATALNEPNIDMDRLQQGHFDAVLYDNGKAVIRIGCREDRDEHIDRIANIIEKKFFEATYRYVEAHKHMSLLQRWFERKNLIRQDDEVWDEIQNKELEWISIQPEFVKRCSDDFENNK